MMRRPDLWLEAIRAASGMRRRGAATIDARYTRWRQATAYGNGDVGASAEDLVAFLTWRRRQRRLRSHS
ncbi:MAG: hypothetical protein OEO77_15820 [Acidimicrobiia bacterium]|nr:hypothetical protein [Acidimicrobiia bacterium]